MNSNNEAWRGSQERCPTSIMGFIECCSHEDGAVIDLNVSTCTTSLAYLFATLIVNWLLFFMFDMFVVSSASTITY